ncbi:hypothetical protein FRC14_003551, partial [Serendipita sp. 396]
MSATAHAASPSSSSASSGGGHAIPSHLNSPWRPYQLWQRRVYPNQVWIFVGTALGLLVIFNIIHHLRVRSRKNALLRNLNVPTEKAEPTGNNTASWRRLPRAVETGFKIAAFRWTIPYGRTYVLSLAEVFFTVGYLAALLIWSFINSHGAQQPFWSQRTGAIAYKQFMLLPLLAGKNNIITLLTGLSYEKINIMHRAIARTLFILILLHTFQKVESFSRANLTQERYYTGVMGTVAFGAIFLTSLRPARSNAFELFLIIHIILVAVFLAGMYFHQPEDSLYVWLFVGFWLFDRASRVLRMIFVNRGESASRSATITAISQDSIQLVLPNRQIKWNAGQHVFLILPTVSNIPFEAHPFTIANIPERDQRGNKSSETDLVFYIRAMDGFTRKLYEYAQAHNGGTVPALVDGPYGVPPPIHSFTTVILIAGGSGVSFTVPLLLDIVSAARRQKTPVKRVVFVWSVKNYEDLGWASEVLTMVNQTLTPTLSLDLRIHVTRASGLVPSLESEKQATDPMSPMSPISEKGLDSPIKGSRTDVMISTIEDGSTQGGHSMSKVVKTGHGSLKTRIGRPDLSAIIQEEIQASSGPVSVN